MADQYFVYMVVFSRTASQGTRFICFQKKAKGYFFGNGSGGGRILPKGQTLNGGAKFALPGGKFEGTDWNNDDDIMAECEREFIEECGREITFPQNDEFDANSTNTGGGDIHVSAVAQVNRWATNLPSRKGPIKGYAAMYLKVPDDQLETIADYLAVSLGQGDQAEQDVINQVLTAGDYAKIGQTYPLAPLDDELDLCKPAIYEIAAAGFDDDPLWTTLDSQGGDWFKTILQYLPNL